MVTLTFAGSAAYLRTEWNSGPWDRWWRWAMEKETPKSISTAFWISTSSNPGTIDAWKRSSWECPGICFVYITSSVYDFWPICIAYFTCVFCNQVARIETEKMLIQMVETELEKRKQEGAYKAQFKGQSHFFGYSFLSKFPNRFFALTTNLYVAVCDLGIRLEGYPWWTWWSQLISLTHS